jgi:hypothetical protein
MDAFRFLKFFVAFAAVLAFGSACRYCGNAGKQGAAPTPFVAEELKSEIPFSTKEPEIFQVEIVTAANEIENKIFLARSGANRRIDYSFGEKNQVAFLQSDKNYLIFPREKIYAEDAGQDSFAPETATDFLTSGLLNAKTGARFFSEGKENNLAKYRVVFGDAEKSESIVFVDEALNLPVKQEFYSVDGERKTLTMTIEFRNFKPEAGAELFKVPKDFRKVSMEEFRKLLKKEK